jgi:hypothetical protein
MRKLFAVALLALSTGCAGGRTWITAPTANYPVSISEGMRGPDGALLSAREMQVVGHFTSEHTGWNLLYSSIPLTPHKNISEEINAQIAAVQGDGIVRLSTSSKPCALDYFVILTIIPFWPGCADVDLKGDIIRYSPASPPMAPPASAQSLPSGTAAGALTLKN